MIAKAIRHCTRIIPGQHWTKRQDCTNITFFPFRRKNVSKKSLSKNYLKWFIDWLTTYLKHTSAYVIMTMCFIRIKILNNFANSFKWKCDCRSDPAGTVTLSQRCRNVVIDVVTTSWHGRKWELCRRRFSTLWQRRSPTLSRSSHNVAATSPQH